MVYLVSHLYFKYFCFPYGNLSDCSLKKSAQRMFIAVNLLGKA